MNIQSSGHSESDSVQVAHHAEDDGRRSATQGVDLIAHTQDHHQKTF